MFKFHLNMKAQKILMEKIEIMEEKVKEVQNYYNNMLEQIASHRDNCHSAYRRLHTEIRILKEKQNDN